MSRFGLAPSQALNCCRWVMATYWTVRCQQDLGAFLFFASAVLIHLNNLTCESQILSIFQALIGPDSLGLTHWAS